MEPMQQPTPPTQPNPYEFITSSPQPVKKSLFGGGSTKSRVILVIIGILLLMILGSVAATLLSSASRAAAQDLKNIVAAQEELIRVAELGAKDAQSADVRARAYIIILSTRSSQQDIKGLLESSKTKLEPKDLLAKKNTKTDEALTAAAASNRYDEAFSEELDKQLNSYLANLQSVYKDMSGEKTRAVLSAAYESASTIVTAKTES